MPKSIFDYIIERGQRSDKATCWSCGRTKDRSNDEFWSNVCTCSIIKQGDDQTWLKGRPWRITKTRIGSFTCNLTTCQKCEDKR